MGTHNLGGASRRASNYCCVLFSEERARAEKRARVEAALRKAGYIKRADGTWDSDKKSQVIWP